MNPWPSGGSAKQTLADLSVALEQSLGALTQSFVIEPEQGRERPRRYTVEERAEHSIPERLAAWRQKRRFLPFAPHHLEASTIVVD
jgi:hypothetical protein